MRTPLGMALKTIEQPVPVPDKLTHGLSVPRLRQEIKHANVIEHLVPDETSDILAKCYEMLDQEGYLVVLTPHSFSGPHDVSKYFVSFGSKAEGFHLKEFSFTDMNQFLMHAGFQKVWGFPFHPRLLGKYRLTPKPSEWAARKSMILEKVAQRGPFAKLLRLGRTSTRMLTALAFPAVAVGVKRVSGTSGQKLQ